MRYLILGIINELITMHATLNKISKNFTVSAPQPMMLNDVIALDSL